MSTQIWILAEPQQKPFPPIVVPLSLINLPSTYFLLSIERRIIVLKGVLRVVILTLK